MQRNTRVFWMTARPISVATRTNNKQAFNKATDSPSGAVSSPLAGPCGGMDAATEPPRTNARRVPQAVRAPRTRLTKSGLKNVASSRKVGADGAEEPEYGGTCRFPAPAAPAWRLRSRFDSCSKLLTQCSAAVSAPHTQLTSLLRIRLTNSSYQTALRSSGRKLPSSCQRTVLTRRHANSQLELPRKRALIAETTGMANLGHALGSMQ